MNIYTSCLCSMLLLFPVLGCAEQPESSTKQKTSISSKNVVTEASRKTTILQSGDVLILSAAKGKPVASYLSTMPADKAVIAGRIIQILKNTQANKSFVEFVATSLPENRVLKKDNFTLPLVDVDGTEHRFTYNSDIEYSLYFINYQLIPAQ